MSKPKKPMPNLAMCTQCYGTGEVRGGGGCGQCNSVGWLIVKAK